MRITSRADLARWLDGLAERTTVIAPRRVGDEIVYGAVNTSAEVVWHFQRTALPAKTFFLPDTEAILEVEIRDEQVGLTEPALEREQVLWGLRPCDARGLRVLDALLLDRPPPDSYYAERRGRTTLVGLACPRLWDNCFCTSLGGAPDDASEVDVMLYEGEGGYWVEAVTEKGVALLEGLPCGETDGDRPASDPSGGTVPVLPPERWGALFDEPYWQRLADRCLSCRACTYVCPTCRCFDVRDQSTAVGAGYRRIERLRAWDSCLASAYRRIAGGHDPRSTTAQRLRNRVYCKFCYFSQAPHPTLSPGGEGKEGVGCVGCGRCIAVCPVGIDVAEVLADVSELEERSKR